MSEQTSRPPRDNIIRAVTPGAGFRAAGDGDGEDGGPVLFGHFARFNEWTEIDSWFEGHFLERIAPGAFKKTFKEMRDRMRVLFQHGRDPEVGDKPIAKIEDLREDDEGAYYEAGLFDGVPGLIMDGLRGEQYGASFRFSVMREEYVEEPPVSDHNPHGIPERTLKELRVPEFGPVTFPAYESATAGVRSLTDQFIFDWIAREPQRARDLVGNADLSRAAFRAANEQDPPDAPSDRDAEPDAHLTPERREQLEPDTPAEPLIPLKGIRQKETKPWRP